jgi:hypothetical protein
LRSLVLATALAALSGCNKSNDFPGCDVPSDPSTSRRIRVCPPSEFDTSQVPGWRDVSGQVWRGEIGISGAIVQTSPTNPTSTSGPTQVTATESNGFFRPIHGVDLRYDLTVRSDLDVLTVRDVALRYVQPSFDGPPDRVDGFRKTILPQVDPPVAPDHAVAFFATGTTAFGIEGDLEHGVTLIDSAYDAPATIHAVEYVRGKDFLSATAYGNSQMVVSAATPQVVSIHLAPVTDYATHTLDFAAPPSFKTSAELFVAFSRSSFARAENVPVGSAFRLPILPGSSAGISYRVVSTGPDGSLVDSGEQFFSPDPHTQVVTATIPDVLSPAENAIVDGTTSLSASGEGVFVHLLRSTANGSTIRVVTTHAVTNLPDLSSLGLPTPKGEYEWTVRTVPDLKFVESYSGVDAGRYDTSAISKPRKVVFR